MTMVDKPAGQGAWERNLVETCPPNPTPTAQPIGYGGGQDQQLKY
jgi:hypothetical protein